MKKFEEDDLVFIMGSKEEALELGFGRKWSDGQIGIESNYDPEIGKTTLFAHKNLPVVSILSFLMSDTATNVGSDKEMSDEDVHEAVRKRIKFFLQAMIACGKTSVDEEGHHFVSLYAGRGNK